MIDEEVKLLLTHLNPRRFTVLVHASQLGSTFTAQSFKAIYPSESSSLTRDLNALEAAGLLLASPPMSAQRQGQQVQYRIAPDVVHRFQRLVDLVSQSSATQLPLS